MKKLLCILLSLALLAGCSAAPAGTTQPKEPTGPVQSGINPDGIAIRLSDESVEFPADSGISIANDIIYYEEGHDASYGEGERGDAHSAEEAAAHTVVHINAPGTYVISGKLELGQIAVDLGEDAKKDPGAVVTLILDGIDITCTVAPAIIFYSVYECSDKDNPTANVDTSAAGANVILPEGSVNYVNGSHVAKIYKPGTEKKLHKYDAAFYSKMSMNVGGEGFLMITADNEGLDSELHLTINGGQIYIKSGNDGINTNEDGVSVTTINGGTLRIDVTGSTGEGDGIDSNGWLVINGGNVFAYACGSSMDSGIDSDMGILIHGGTVVATGNMLDQIEAGSQTHVVFTFAQTQRGGQWTLKNAKGEAVAQCEAPNAFSNLIFSSPALAEGAYTLWSGDTQFQGRTGMGGGFGGGMGGFIGGGEIPGRPEWPDRGGADVEIPPQPTNPVVTQGQVQPPQGQQPENMPVPDFSEGFAPGQMPGGPAPQGGENMPVPGMPQGVNPPQGGGFGGQFFPGTVIITGEAVVEFVLTQGANYFSNVMPVE